MKSENRLIPNRSCVGPPIWTLLAAFLLAAIFLSVGYAEGQSQENTISEKFHYDGEGKLESVEYIDGNLIKFEYDDHRRPVKIDYPDDTVRYGYDVNGSRTLLENKFGKTNYQYDAFGRLNEITHQYGIENKVKFEYGGGGRVSKIILLSDRIPISNISYSRDSLGNIIKIDDGTGPITFKYDYKNGEITRQLPNGIKSVFSFSSLGELTSIKHLHSERGLITSYRYEYDMPGMISRVIEKTSSAITVTRYELNTKGWLQRIYLHDGTIIDYEYDSTGTLLIEKNAGRTIRYDYDNWGRLIRAGESAYEYDRSDNITILKEKNGKSTFKYNSKKLPDFVETPNGPIEIRYDGDGSIVADKRGGKVTRYLTNPLDSEGSLLATFDRNGKMLEVYLHGNGPIGRRDAKGKMVYFLEDGFGNIRSVVDAKGRVAPTDFPQKREAMRPLIYQYRYSNRQYASRVMEFIDKGQNLPTLSQDRINATENVWTSGAYNEIDPYYKNVIAPLDQRGWGSGKAHDSDLVEFIRSTFRTWLPNYSLTEDLLRVGVAGHMKLYGGLIDNAFKGFDNELRRGGLTVSPRPSVNEYIGDSGIFPKAEDLVSDIAPLVEHKELVFLNQLNEYQGKVDGLKASVNDLKGASQKRAQPAGSFGNLPPMQGYEYYHVPSSKDSARGVKKNRVIYESIAQFHQTHGTIDNFLNVLRGNLTPQKADDQSSSGIPPDLALQDSDSFKKYGGPVRLKIFNDRKYALHRLRRPENSDPRDRSPYPDDLKNWDLLSREEAIDLLHHEMKLQSLSNGSVDSTQNQLFKQTSGIEWRMYFKYPLVPFGRRFSSLLKSPNNTSITYKTTNGTKISTTAKNYLNGNITEGASVGFTENHKALVRETLDPKVTNSLDKLGAKVQLLGEKSLGGLGISWANYDEYAITVKPLAGFDPESFFKSWAADMNSVPHGDGAKIFKSVNSFSTSKTALNVGDIIRIKILADSGDVVIIKNEDHYFRVATIKNLPGGDGTHPVSGIREFGYLHNSDGTITFYTRGVDSPYHWGAQLVGVSAQKKGWSAFMQGIGERFGLSAKEAREAVQGYSGTINAASDDAIIRLSDHAKSELVNLSELPRIEYDPESIYPQPGDFGIRTGSIGTVPHGWTYWGQMKIGEMGFDSIELVKLTDNNTRIVPKNWISDSGINKYTLIDIIYAEIKIEWEGFTDSHKESPDFYSGSLRVNWYRPLESDIQVSYQGKKIPLRLLPLSVKRSILERYRDLDIKRLGTSRGKYRILDPFSPSNQCIDSILIPLDEAIKDEGVIVLSSRGEPSTLRKAVQVLGQTNPLAWKGLGRGIGLNMKKLPVRPQLGVHVGKSGLPESRFVNFSLEGKGWYKVKRADWAEPVSVLDASGLSAETMLTEVSNKATELGLGSGDTVVVGGDPDSVQMKAIVAALVSSGFNVDVVKTTALEFSEAITTVADEAHEKGSQLGVLVPYQRAGMGKERECVDSSPPCKPLKVKEERKRTECRDKNCEVSEFVIPHVPLFCSGPLCQNFEANVIGEAKLCPGPACPNGPGGKSDDQPGCPPHCGSSGARFNDLFNTIEANLGGVGLEVDPSTEDLNIGRLRAVAYDSRRERLVLIGDAHLSVGSIRIGDLAEALALIYNPKFYGPQFSLDPADPLHPEGKWLKAVYIPNILEGTEIGRIMYETDWLLKQYAFGVEIDSDNKLRERHSKVTEYRGTADISLSNNTGKEWVQALKQKCAGIDIRPPKSIGNGEAQWSRMWIEVKDQKIRLQKVDGAILIEEPKMVIKAKRQVPDPTSSTGLRDVESDDPHSKTFAKEFECLYDDIALESPAYVRLKEYAKALVVAKWLKESGLAFKGDWVRENLYDNTQFIEKVSALSWSKEKETRTKILSIHLFGGVDLTTEPKFIAETGKASRIKDFVNSKLNEDASNRFALTLDGENLVGVVVPLGNKVKTADAKVRVIKGIRYELGEKGEIIKSTSPDGAEASYAYNSAGKLASSEMQLGNGVKLNGKREANGSVWTATNSQGNRFTYHYDPSGLLKKIEVNNQKWADYAYDEKKREVLITYSDTVEKIIFDSSGIIREYQVKSLSSHEAERFGFSYNDAGKVTNIRNSEVSLVDISYQDGGTRPSLITTPQAESKYSYDADGKIRSMLHSSGLAVTYSYLDDRVNKLQVTYKEKRAEYLFGKNGISQSRHFLGGLTKYNYSSGKISSVALNENTKIEYFYDKRDRLKEIHSSDGRWVEYKYGEKNQFSDGYTVTATLHPKLSGQSSSPVSEETRLEKVNIPNLRETVNERQRDNIIASRNLDNVVVLDLLVGGKGTSDLSIVDSEGQNQKIDKDVSNELRDLMDQIVTVRGPKKELLKKWNRFYHEHLEPLVKTSYFETVDGKRVKLKTRLIIKSNDINYKNAPLESVPVLSDNFIISITHQNSAAKLSEKIVKIPKVTRNNVVFAIRLSKEAQTREPDWIRQVEKLGKVVGEENVLFDPSKNEFKKILERKDKDVIVFEFTHIEEGVLFKNGDLFNSKDVLNGGDLSHIKYLISGIGCCQLPRIEDGKYVSALLEKGLNMINASHKNVSVDTALKRLELLTELLKDIEKYDIPADHLIDVIDQLLDISNEGTTNLGKNDLQDDDRLG